MTQDAWIWLLIGAVAALMLGLPVALAMQRRSLGPAKEPAESLDTVAGWPPEPTRVLGTHERLAYQAVTRAMPEHLVLAEVALARFLEVPRRHSYSEWLKRAGHLSADLLVCDGASRVLAVVVLRTPQDSSRRMRRIQRIQRVLNAARVRVLVWTASENRSAEQIREAILPTTPTAPLPGSRAARPASAASDADAAPAIANITAGLPLPVPLVHEEPGHMAPAYARQAQPSPDRDTPPSTWFDDFESGPMPLHAPARVPSAAGEPGARASQPTAESSTSRSSAFMPEQQPGRARARGGA